MQQVRLYIDDHAVVNIFLFVVLFYEFCHYLPVQKKSFMQISYLYALICLLFLITEFMLRLRLRAVRTQEDEVTLFFQSL